LVIVVVFLCGVIFFVYRRYRKVLQVGEKSHKPESEMYIVKTKDIEEQIQSIVAGNFTNSKVDFGKTMYNEGENYNAEYGKLSNHKVGEEKNERTEKQLVSDQPVDICFALNKVNSYL